MNLSLRPLHFAVALTTALGVAASGGIGGASEEPVGYTFNEAPFNARGVQSMEDLRGKPVLIDFWGTR
jgi:hypothetical protein